MPRVTVCIPNAILVRADLPSLLLQADNMITRFRDLVYTEPRIAVALARIVAQTTYRLASERYRYENDRLCMTIELTIDELRELYNYHARIIDELAMKKQYYEELIANGECKNRTRCEERMAAIEAWIEIIRELVGKYRKKEYAYVVRG